MQSVVWNEMLTAKDIISYVTKYGCFTYPRFANDPGFQRIAGRYIKWLEYSGHPLGSFPSDLQESSLVDAALVAEIDNRRLSTMLLLHLCMASRLVPSLSDNDVVVEIGGGYGGLARVIKLLKPRVTYLIIDLPESLFFSHVFLRESLGKNATILYVLSNEKLSDRDIAQYDVVLVPTFFKDCLHGIRAKATLNTMSLGEMNQHVVDDYMKFLQSHIYTQYYYSINRYGIFPGAAELWSHHAPRVLPGAVDSYATINLDRDWEVLIWDLWGETSFQQIEDCSAPYLELLARRLPQHSEDDLSVQKKSLALYDAARRMPHRAGAWHYFMWDSIRLFPARSSLDDYCDHLTRFGFPELTLYSALRDSTTVDFGATAVPEISVGRPPYPDRTLPIAGEFKFQIEEMQARLIEASTLLDKKVPVIEAAPLAPPPSGAPPREPVEIAPAAPPTHEPPPEPVAIAAAPAPSHELPPQPAAIAPHTTVHASALRAMARAALPAKTYRGNIARAVYRTGLDLGRRTRCAISEHLQPESPFGVFIRAVIRAFRS
jgi:hypothetical protein